VRMLPLAAVGLGAAAMVCLAAAPLARSFTPPEPLTITDPIGDVAIASGGRQPGPDIESVTLSQPDEGTLRVAVAFADPLLLREKAPVVEDGVRLMFGHPITGGSYQSLAAWVGAADPSRVLLTDLAQPWHPGSVATAGSARVDGTVLTIDLSTEALRSRTRAGQPVDPDLPLTWSVHTSLGWAAAAWVPTADAADTAASGDAAPDGGSAQPYAWAGPAVPTPLSRTLSAGAAVLAALATALLAGPPVSVARRRRREQRRQEALDRPTPDEEFGDVELLSSSR